MSYPKIKAPQDRRLYETMWEITAFRVPLKLILGAIGIVVIPTAAFAAAFAALWLLLILNGVAIQGAS